MKELREYSTAELLAEVRRRNAAAMEKRCGYCGFPQDTTRTCAKPEMHFTDARFRPRVNVERNTITGTMLDMAVTEHYESKNSNSLGPEDFGGSDF